MFIRAENRDINLILGALEKVGEYNVRLSALINAYSLDKPFFNVFHDEDKTIIGELEGNFYIAETENMNFEEIHDFLEFYPNVKTILGKRKTIQKLGFKEKGKTYNLLTLNEAKSQKNDAEIETTPDLKDIYELLKASGDDDFTVTDIMPWYADMSHRIRHASAKTFILKEGEKNVSCLLVSAFSQNAALISGVTTLPEKRHKGNAKKLLSAVLSDDLFKTRTAVVECEDRLLGFYEQLGFKKSGDIEILK